MLPKLMCVVLHLSVPHTLSHLLLLPPFLYSPLPSSCLLWLSPFLYSALPSSLLCCLLSSSPPLPFPSPHCTLFFHSPPLLCPPHMVPDQVLVPQVNSYLPEVIRVITLKRVTKGFDSRHICNARTYEYLLPTYAFAPYRLTTVDYRIDGRCYNMKSQS